MPTAEWRKRSRRMSRPERRPVRLDRDYVLRTEVAAEAEADAAVVTEIAQARRKRRNELSGFFERRSLPTPDEVRGALNFLPFRPFKVSLIGGDVIEVRRADSVAI